MFRKSPRAKWLIGIAAIVVLIMSVMAATDAHNSMNMDPSSREAMISVLGSPNPNPSLGEEAQTFDRLIGSWDADFGFPQADGTVRHKKGELHFGWVMDGHAVQDLWIGYPTGEQKERTIGTTFRFFDTKLKQWRIVFINPQYNYVVTTQGGREGDRIVLPVQVRSEDQIFFIVSARRLDACVTPSERKRSKSESQASCSSWDFAQLRLLRLPRSQKTAALLRHRR